MKRLIKTLHGEQGELSCICDGRRILLSRCRPAVEILEEIQYISAIGNCGRVEFLNRLFWTTCARLKLICQEIGCLNWLDRISWQKGC